MKPITAPRLLASLGLAALLPVAAQAQTVFLNETFESDTLGAAPADTAQRRTLLTTVTAGSGLIGTDNMAHFNDNSTTGGGALEYNVGSSALGSLYVSFDLVNNAANATGTAANPIIFGVAAWNDAASTVLSSNASRYFGLEFYQVGASSTLRVRNSAGSAFLNTTYDMAALISVKIFINDHATNTLDYVLPGTSTTATLGANSAVIFLNDTLLSGETMSGFVLTGASGTGDATLGRLGFNSSSTNTPNFFLDNIHASTIPSAIPEPSTAAALAGAGMLAFAALRRRRA